MKKIVVSVMTCLFLLAVTLVNAQETRTQTLTAFTKLNLEGNIEIHLVKSNQSSIKVETKKAKDFENFSIEVKHNELNLIYKEQRSSNTPKFTVYLEHTGIEEVTMSGLISLFSDTVLNGPELTLKGSGIIKGEIEIDVDDFQIDSDGITNLTISGAANNATFNIDGLGKIKAQNLIAKSVQQHLDGFAKVKVGS